MDEITAREMAQRRQQQEREQVGEAEYRRRRREWGRRGGIAARGKSGRKRKRSNDQPSP